MPLPILSPLAPGAVGPATRYPDILGPPALNVLTPPLLPPQAPPLPPLPPPTTGANLAAIGLPAVGAVGGPNALGVGYPVGMDPWVAAMNNARLGVSTMANSNIIASKAEQMRSLFLMKAEDIYQRLVTIRFTIAPLQARANAAATARAALVELINSVNAQGYIDPNQALALNDLATELDALDIPNLINALVGEINELSGVVGLAEPRPVPGYPINAADAGPNPIQFGGSKNSRKKGGYKFTKAAKKRRSLRMSKRKSLSRMHKKTKRKRKRKTKKHH